MGQIFSGITDLVGLVQKFRNQKREDEADVVRRRLDKNKTPIKPPKFYLTIEERSIVDKDNPYSTSSIRDSLEKNIIPAGYSLEQLSEVGFEKEVKDYQDRLVALRNKDKKLIKDSLEKIVSILSTNFPDLTKEDRNALSHANLLDVTKNKVLISKIKDWISQIDSDQIEAKTIDNILSIVQLKTGLITDALSKEQTDLDVQKEISDAQTKKDSLVLGLIRRSLNYKKPQTLARGIARSSVASAV